jgi:hypothetical protein
MTTLLENPLPIIVVGGLVALVAGMVFFSRRSGGSLAALVGTVLATLALLLVERLVATDREQIESAIANLLAAIEANDLKATLAVIDPAAAKVRDHVQTMEPLIKVEKARSIGRIEVTVDDGAQPPTADATIQAFLQGVHEQSAMQVGYFNQRVDLHWIKRGDQWLLDDYTAYYEGQPIDAVGSASGNRAIPSR